jgi:Putative transmembrane protein (PGPGW)
MSRVELSLGIVGVVMFLGMLLAIPWLVRRLPADYFVQPPPEHSLVKKVVRNVAGAVLIAAGIAMLVLPGQGIITILLGLSIIDLPIKHRIMRWLLLRPTIQAGVQQLRARSGKPPLIIPAHA